MQPTRRCTGIIAICLILLLNACSTQPGRPTVATDQRKPPDNARHTVITTAHEMLDMPYRYGGRSPRGFDCSGLVWYSHRQAGIEVPRTAARQMTAASAVAPQSIREGDLLFFRIDGAKSHHVGIYIGDGRFIHAPSSGKKVTSDRLDNPYWRARLLRAGHFY
ncbi:C40 family peptidase [Thiogranum longum]